MYKQYVNDPMDDPDVSSNSGARRTPDAAGPAAEPSDAAAASKKKEETVKLQVSCNVCRYVKGRAEDTVGRCAVARSPQVAAIEAKRSLAPTAG